MKTIFGVLFDAADFIYIGTHGIWRRISVREEMKTGGYHLYRVNLIREISTLRQCVLYIYILPYVCV